jgi:transketolase
MLKNIANKIKLTSIELVAKANSGHATTSTSSAEM